MIEAALHDAEPALLLAVQEYVPASPETTLWNKVKSRNITETEWDLLQSMLHEHTHELSWEMRCTKITYFELQNSRGFAPREARIWILTRTACRRQGKQDIVFEPLKCRRWLCCITKIYTCTLCLGLLS